MSRLLVVSGPESSGNRLLYDLLQKITEFRGDGEDTESWWRDEKMVKHSTENRITLRSMPHGGGKERRLYDPVAFCERAYADGFGRVDLLIPTRDEHIVVRSKARHHTKGDLTLAGVELSQARQLIRSALASPFRDKVWVVSYETLLFLGLDYLAWILGQMSLGWVLTYEKRQEIAYYPMKNGNFPYLRPLGDTP